MPKTLGLCGFDTVYIQLLEGVLRGHLVVKNIGFFDEKVVVRGQNWSGLMLTDAKRMVELI